MKFLSIKTRVMFGTAIVVVAVIASVMGLITMQRKQAVTENKRDQFALLSEYTGQLVEFYLGDAERSLENLARDGAVEDVVKTWDPEALSLLSARMAEIKDANPVFESMALFDLDCVLRGADPQALPLVGRSFAERDYCSGVINAKSTYISAAFNSSATNHIVLSVAAPVFDGTGKMMGFLVGAVHVLDLQSSLSALQGDNKTLLLDRYGSIFLDTERPLLDVVKNSDEASGSLARVAYETSRTGDSEGFFLHEQADEDVVVGYKRFEHFTVVIEQPKREAFSLFYKAVNTQILAGSSVVVLMLASLWFLLGPIVHRLKRLTSAMDRISKGDTHVKISEKEKLSTDEIGELARAFDRLNISVKYLLEEEGDNNPRI